MVKTSSFVYIARMEKNLRFSGVLLHPTSFPGRSGIGEFGYECERFIDILGEAGIGLWQILPLSPVGFGNSPYAASSAFAGEELLISLEKLVDSGLLTEEDLLSLPEFSLSHVEFDKVRSYKSPLLRRAAERFLSSSDTQEYTAFLEKESYWITDYALFKAAGDHFGDFQWHETWPAGLARREASEIEKWKEKLGKEIEIIQVLQYFFHSQWEDIHSYAHEKGVAIVGDIPIFVAHESADVWCHREFLKLDSNGKRKKVAGVPPDAFSSTGQLWGNPVYDWDALKKDEYSWWLERIHHQLRMTDMVRVDHFRGFEAAWEVDASETTAENGSWVKAPGDDFFSFLAKKIGHLPFIAEDLGVITEEVDQLRIDHGFPGMKILQFAFSYTSEGSFDAEHFYLPHTYPVQCAAYTGTHDNNTTRGWYDALNEGDKNLVRRYLSCDDSSVVWYAVRSVMASSARYAIIPFQDVLDKGAETRMNAPGTVGDPNWMYRVLPQELGRDVKEKLVNMTEPFGRTAGIDELKALSSVTEAE